jgi:hypothetical protein
VPEGLQVLRGVRQRQTHFDRQRLDSALALRQQFQKLQSMWTPDGFADARELRIETVFELAVRFRHDHVINILLE